MNKENKVILVTGATGKQGGAVAKHLLKDGWKVRALVRDETKDSAKELTKLGAELFKGDMENAESMVKATEGVYGVFSVQNFWEHGYDGELKQAENVINAASKSGVKHFVYTSVGGAERETKLPHFDVKFVAEKLIKSLNLPSTILRPVFFMENFEGWFGPVETDGKLLLSMALKANTKLQMIAVDDIGFFVTKVFDNPEEYMGKEIELAGDELTLAEMANEYSKATGKEVQPNELPVDIVKSNNAEVGDMFQWFIDEGYQADIKKLREIHPGLKTFADWLTKLKVKS